MKRIIFTAVLPLLLNSCLITSSENPLNTPSGTSVDPSPFLGEWVATTMFGDAVQGTNVLTITQSTNGVLTAAYTDGIHSNSEAVVLTSVNGMPIACVQHGGNEWGLFAVTIVSNGAKLVVSAPNWSIITNDIVSGVITGEVDTIEPHSHIVRILASGSVVRSYLEGKTNFFGQFLFLDKK